MDTSVKLGMNILMSVYNHFRGVAKKKNNFVMAAILDFQNFVFSENVTMGLLSMLSLFKSNLNYFGLDRILQALPFRILYGLLA